MDVSTKRIVILGKTGHGKSSLGNTISAVELFKIGKTGNSETNVCQVQSRPVNGQRIILVDTPGFFDPGRPEEELKAEIVRSITQCCPGPHVFLIVLKVERFTEQEQAVINKIQRYFSEEVFKYAAVLFTHGEQLHEKQEIMDFVRQNQLLLDLVEKCGGRCHVVDNKYWKNGQQDEYRSNKFQVEQLLKTIDKITEVNRGGCYTNEMLQAAEKEIQQEEERIRQSSPNMSEEEIREQAKDNTSKKMLIKLAGVTTGALLGAFLCVGVSVVIIVKALKKIVIPLLKAGRAVRTTVAGGGAIAVAGRAAGEAGAAGEAALKVVGAGSAAVGAVVGGFTGYQAAVDAETVLEGGKKAAESVWDGALSVLDRANDFMNSSSDSSS